MLAFYTVTLDTNYGPLNFEIDVTSPSPATDTATVRINGKDLVINDLTVDVKTDLVKVNTIEKVLTTTLWLLPLTGCSGRCFWGSVQH